MASNPIEKVSALSEDGGGVRVGVPGGGGGSISEVRQRRATVPPRGHPRGFISVCLSLSVSLFSPLSLSLSLSVYLCVRLSRCVVLYSLASHDSCECG